MKYDKNKTYPAHKSKRCFGRITALGLGVSLGDLTREQADIKFTLCFLLIYVTVDFVIFIIQYISGRYARVSFSDDGFTYRKHVKSEFVLWDDVVSVESISMFVSNISYYLIKAKCASKQKEYLVEKNIVTKPIMDKLYFKDNKNDRTLRLPFQSKQRIDFFTLTFGMAFIGCIFAAAFEYNGKLSVSAMIWIISCIILVALASTAVYFYIKRNESFKVNDTGVFFKSDGEDIAISWSDAKKAKHFVERLGAKDYHILELSLGEALKWKYDTVEVPVSFTRLEKVCKVTEVTTK